MTASRPSGVRQVHAICVNAGQNPAPRNLSRQNSPTVAQSGALLRPGDDAVALKREAERRTLFQKTSNNVLDIPNGYRKVEVLILRWDESIDEFKDGHNQEVTYTAHQCERMMLIRCVGPETRKAILQRPWLRRYSRKYQEHWQPPGCVQLPGSSACAPT